MPSRTSAWPSGWPSFTPKDNDPSNTYQKDLKAKIVAKYGAENLRIAWIKTCSALESITARLASVENASIPILSYDEAISLDSQALEKSKESGCFVIRGVIPREEAIQHFEDLKVFVADNRDTITGWPAKSIAIYSIFSSPVQLKIKTNPRHLKLQRRLNSIWKDSSCATAEEQAAQFDPVLYPDALRIRQPGQEFLGLGPHIDGGSL
jgi:hypothetical protein